MPPPSSRSAISSPAAAASAVCGAAPTATSTACAGCSSPSSVWAASTMPSSPSIAVMLGAEVELHAAVLVQLREEGAELRAQGVVQRGGPPFDHGHLGAEGAGRRRDLQADPAGADHQQPAVLPAEGLQGPPEPFGVGEPAQVVHAAEVDAGHLQRARRGAGGQQQPVVGQHAAVGQDDRARRPVQRGGRGVEPQLDLVGGVPRGLVDEEVRARGTPGEVVLGQPGPLVRVFPFLADQDHPAGEPLGAEGLGRLRPGQSGPDDDMGLVCVHHVCSPDRSTAVRPASCKGG